MHDLAVVGAGIVGLAHAYVAAKAGLKVIVVEREACAVHASVRNFGFLTITGQAFPETWNRALRSRSIWEDVCQAAKIPIIHRNLAVVAKHSLSRPILQNFMTTPMAKGCTLLEPEQLTLRLPMVNQEGLLCGLWSTHEARIEARTAIPLLTRYLADELGVSFRWNCAVHGVSTRKLETNDGLIRAGRIVVSPGRDIQTLFPNVLALHEVGLTKLQMLRIADPGWRLPATVMGDLGIARYRGYAELPDAGALQVALSREQPNEVAAGIHLIVVQSEDGSLVVGDSHHYGQDALSPFQSSEVDQLILSQLSKMLNIPTIDVIERWTGRFPVRPGGDALIEEPEPHVHLVVVTSGTGMSTSFAIAEEVLADAIKPGNCDEKSEDSDRIELTLA